MSNKKPFFDKSLWRYMSLLMLFLVPIICVAPFILLSAYTNPNAEDFSHSFLPQVSTAFYAVFDFYKNKEARLFTHLLYAFNPLKFGVLEAYKILPVLILTLFVFTLYYFFNCVFKKRELRHFVFVTTMLVFCVFLAQMPSPAHAIYWMSSSFNYSPPLMMFLVLLGLLLKSTRDMATGVVVLKKRLFVMMLLIFLTVLSNEIYILFLNLFFLITCVHAYLFKKREAGLLLTLFIISVIVSSLYVFPHILMPEISHGRISIDSAMMVSAVNLSFLNTFRNLMLWIVFNPPLIILSLLFVVFLNRYFGNFPHLTTHFIRVNMFLFIPFVVFMLFLLLFPYYLFRDPTHEPQRIFNVQYLLFLIAWFYGLTHIILYSKRKAVTQGLSFPTFLYTMILGAFLLTSISSKNITTAYDDLFSGRAAAYDREMHERFEIIEMVQQTKHKTAIVDELQNKPVTIFFPPDPEAGSSSTMWHEAYEKYFNLKHIIVFNAKDKNNYLIHEKHAAE